MPEISARSMVKLKVLVVAIGSTGDASPRVPVVMGLLHAGHDVRVVCSPEGATLFRALQVPTFVTEKTAEEHIQRTSPFMYPEDKTNPFPWRTYAIRLRGIAKEFTLSSMSAYEAASIGGIDVVLNSPVMHGFEAYVVARRYKAKVINCFVSPEVQYSLSYYYSLNGGTKEQQSYLPTLQGLCTLLQHILHALPAFHNLVCWLDSASLFSLYIEDGSFAEQYLEAVNAWGDDEFTEFIKSRRSHISVNHLEHIPVIYGFSPSLVPRSPSWGANIVVCGEWASHVSNQLQGNKQLNEWLLGGSAPIYIGFGSMSARPEAPGVYCTTIKVASKMGHRVLVCMPSNLLPEISGDSQVFRVDKIAHSSYIPKCCMAIHHAGSGTAHTVTKCGVPSIGIDFAFDQRFWARQLHEIGVGARPLRAGWFAFCDMHSW
eukprot:CAMPEP_0183820828 /NCGR_PEP_ID=MMETSP0803_2-20130417/64841_1 /TAXON_ID=195967 /ORGANISM="Crustomastix stigmata, Strain CCMP3273" /LENGTH=429 /DNA_ID=CAMNT_0026065725 /DNA_START=2306 /DNA_END=3592 /DNA_ORIENTATION=+